MGRVPEHGILAVWGSKLGLLPAARQLCAVDAKCCRMQLEWLKMMHMSCGYWPMLVLCTFLQLGGCTHVQAMWWNWSVQVLLAT